MFGSKFSTTNRGKPLKTNKIRTYYNFFNESHTVSNKNSFQENELPKVEYKQENPIPIENLETIVSSDTECAICDQEKSHTGTIIDFAGKFNYNDISSPVTKYLVPWKHNQAASNNVSNNQILIPSQRIIQNIWMNVKTKSNNSRVKATIYVIPKSQVGIIYTNLTVSNHGQKISSNLNNSVKVHPGDQIGIKVEIVSGIVEYVNVTFELL